jgi:hypothetical protein
LRTWTIAFCSRATLLLQRLQRGHAQLRRLGAAAEGPAVPRLAAELRDDRALLTRAARDFLSLTSAVSRYSPAVRTELFCWHLEKGPALEAAADEGEIGGAARRAVAAMRLSQAQLRSLHDMFDLFEANNAAAVEAWVKASRALGRALGGGGGGEGVCREQAPPPVAPAHEEAPSLPTATRAPGGAPPPHPSPCSSSPSPHPPPPPLSAAPDAACADLVRALALFRAASDHLAVSILALITPAQLSHMCAEWYPYAVRAPPLAQAAALEWRRWQCAAAAAREEGGEEEDGDDGRGA